MKKRFMALVLACVMALSLLSATAFAADAEAGGGAAADMLEPAVTARNVNGVIVEEVEPLDLSGVDPSCIIELPDGGTAMAAYAGNSEAAQKADKNISFNIAPENPSKVKNLAGYPSKARSAGYQSASLSSVMAEGETEQIYVINVGAGDMVQAELQIPRNLSLDYSFYLCTLDEANANYKVEDFSAYATNSNYLAENVCTINNSGAAMTYYVIIDSHGNPGTGSGDYFTLTASWGGSSDDFEPNDNAFNAFQLPEMTSSTYFTITGILNTPIDNDWFELYIADTSAFSGVTASDFPSNVVVEAYTFNSNAEPVLKGSTANADSLPIKAGYNYFRVISDQSGSFSETKYTLKLVPALKPQKLVTLIAVNGYCQRKSNLFNDWVTRYLFIRSANVQVKVLYSTSNNIMVPVNDTIDVEIDNPMWDNPSMRYHTGSTTIRGKDTCIVNLTAPSTYGLGKYNFVYTTITSSNYGTLAGHVQMALLDHYDDGELSRPCDHNGTCGYK